MSTAATLLLIHVVVFIGSTFEKCIVVPSIFGAINSLLYHHKVSPPIILQVRVTVCVRGGLIRRSDSACRLLSLLFMSTDGVTVLMTTPKSIEQNVLIIMI